MKILLMASPSRSGHNYIMQNIFSWIGGHPRQVDPLTYYNFENFNPEFYDKNFKRRIKKDREPTIKILSNRDLLNWWASWYLQFGKSKKTGGLKNYQQCKMYIESWASITAEMFGETSYMKGIWNFIPVIYDNFYLSREYREKICKEIGGNYNENKMNSVFKGGGGSTFDSLRYDGRGGEMKVLERYKKLEKTHIDILKENPRVIDLYLKYFDVNDSKRKILNL